MNEWFFLCAWEFILASVSDNWDEIASKIDKFKMADIISQIELVLSQSGVRSEWEDNKVSESKKLARIQDGCHHQDESDEWVKFFGQHSWIQDGRIQDGWHHQIELVIESEWSESFWVKREDNKVSEFKMAVSESNMAEFQVAAIINLSQNEWVKFFYVPVVGTNLGISLRGNTRWIEEDARIQDGSHHHIR